MPSSEGDDFANVPARFVDLTLPGPEHAGMARNVVTTTNITDDLDGSANADTVAFGVDGIAWEIDLSKKNRAAFERTMRPYVKAARKVRTSAKRPGGRRSAGTRSDMSQVRAWAAENGLDVSARGRISAAVIDAYHAAH